MSKRKQDGSGPSGVGQRKLFDFGFGGQRQLENDEGDIEMNDATARSFKMKWLDSVGQHFIYDRESDTVTCT